MTTYTQPANKIPARTYYDLDLTDLSEVAHLWLEKQGLEITGNVKAYPRDDMGEHGGERGITIIVEKSE